MSTLENKVALVTGASSGIGRETALALAEAGAAVVIGNRRSPEGEEVARQIRDAGGRAAFLQTDVSKEGQVEALVEFAVSEFGGLDIAFNNAGTDGEPGPIAHEDEGNFDRVIGTNVKGVWSAMRAQIPALRARGGGSIINTSSILGSRGVANFATYAASKFAVEGLTKSVALEVAKQNIRVNAVAPGPIRTPMLEHASGGNTEVFNGIVALGRPGTVDEIAPAVVFLASEQASYITGHSLPIGGGAKAGFVTG